MSKESTVRALIAQWIAYRAGVPEPARYDTLRADLYCARNPGYKGCPPLSAWPAHLIDKDTEVMAAVEHYFLTRGWVGNGVFPAWQVRLMKGVYNAGKQAGLTPRHNPAAPTSPPSALQRKFQDEGIRDGEVDLAKAGGKAPMVTKPPKYW